MISHNGLMACRRLRPAWFFLLLPFCILVMPTGGAEPGVEQGRAGVALTGTWEFRMDPKDEGVAGRWFTADAPYPDKIKVPGNWQAQGFGPPRGHLRHDYPGKAWYRRTVEVPASWAGKRIWLHLGGVTNTAEVYAGGKLVGQAEGFLTPHEFDVTDAIKPAAKNVIACRVDSTGSAPIGMFNFYGRWGGLYREVYLEARSDPAIDDVFVIPDLKNKTARTQVTLRRGTAAGPWQGRLGVRITPAGGGPVLQGQATISFAADKQQSDPATVDVAIQPMRTWSPEDPFLYEVQVSLSAEDKLLDVVRDRFGMREIGVGPGGVLLLNGRPYFIRGLGDDMIEPITGTQYPDKQIYVERLKMVKRYGFNGVRFLAHTPIKEYFQAADEVGVLIMCEGELYRAGWFPPGFPRNKGVHPLLYKQVSRIAKAYRNHPSWYAWTSGNELFNCRGSKPNPDWMAYILYAHKTFKALDPTRFFIGSDGVDVFPTDVITQRGKFGTGEDKYQSRPHIWHEFPNRYVGTLPDLTIMDKWTGVLRDDHCISRYRKQVAELGLTERYPTVRQRSVDFFYLFLKSTFEAARHSRTLDGYAYWLMTDLPPGPEGDMTFFGMFSSVYEPEKYPDPVPIRQFTDETVLLIDSGVGDRVFRAGETKKIALSISHYGSKPISKGRISWCLKAGDETVQQGTTGPVQAEPGEVKQIGQITLGPDQSGRARRLRLHVRLESDACRQQNQWDFWVFPAGKRDLRDSHILNLTDLKELDERYGVNPKEAWEQARLVLTDRLTPKVADHLCRGKTVLLLAEKEALARPRKQSFWAEWIRSTGTFIEPHPALAGFPNDGFCAYQFYRLFGGALETVHITEKGSVEREKLRPIVWAMTTDYDPALGKKWWQPGNRWKLYRHGIVCEGRVGTGKILVCCLRVASGIKNQQPEAGYLLDCLVEYALSDKFAPSSPPMTAEELKQVFRISTPSSR